METGVFKLFYNIIFLFDYFVNKDFIQTTPKVAFLLIGNEDEAKVEWISRGAWIDYAQQYNALCFVLEHRFYGKSHPTK